MHVKNLHSNLCPLISRVDFDETVLIEAEAPKSRKKRQREGEGASQQGSNVDKPKEVCHPVLCDVCETRLGLYDIEEIFHFFGVIASEP